ncbi:CvpA family protein [Streptococcus thoraltensis]|uniref:CvpA family protein n=1 Tax=Streptococcus thoraltensis TaxID=55085 RepID=UPI0003791EB9|nr:CvpA family protein [Streptococcus thoraltensis]MDY4762152.1 CvpA family protein [Streptococcus thoraltensis]
MITLLLLIILAWSFYIGFSRGIFLQAFYTIGSLVALALAKAYYQPLAKVLYIWVPYANPTEGSHIYFFKDVDVFSHDLIFYAGVAFLGVYTLAYAATRFLGVLLHLAPLERFDCKTNNIIAGLLSCLVVCFTLSMGFTILATIPFDNIQRTLSGNGLVRFLIEDFPFFSSYIENLWITQIVK